MELSVEQTVWLAEQLGLTPFVDDAGKVACGVCRYFEPEADDQNGAYWRERIVVWLNEVHGVSLIYYFADEEWEPGWAVSPYTYDPNDLVHEKHYPSYKQALFAAVKWVWAKEGMKDE